jgi:hypothetical protein
MISRFYLAILLYTAALLLIFVLKPAMIFDQEGNIKYFDYDASNTSASLLNIDLVLTFFAIFCYFVIIAIELVL